MAGRFPLDAPTLAPLDEAFWWAFHQSAGSAWPRTDGMAKKTGRIDAGAVRVMDALLKPLDGFQAAALMTGLRIGLLDGEIAERLLAFLDTDIERERIQTASSRRGEGMAIIKALRELLYG